MFEQERIIWEKKEVVRRFLSEELRRDVPSGLTPVRVERSFPRVLAATSPHLRILSRLVTTDII